MIGGRRRERLEGLLAPEGSSLLAALGDGRDEPNAATGRGATQEGPWPRNVPPDCAPWPSSWSCLPAHRGTNPPPSPSAWTPTSSGSGGRTSGSAPAPTCAAPTT